MLWLPGKDTFKHITRIRRQRWRRIARLLLFVFLLFGLGTAAAPPQGSLLVDMAAVTAGHHFDFVDWESQALLDELLRRWNPPPVPDSPKAQQVLVLTFLNQAEHLANLQGELKKNYATRTTESPQTSVLAEKVGQFRAAQSDIQSQVELILARQVETVLHDEGFTIAGTVFPPVAFRFVDPPTALILSPRDRIQNQYFVGLAPGLDYARRAEIEAALDRRGDVSSYVTDIGGLGSYPTMVISHASLPYLIDTIAHEWTHNYFFTFPANLAWAYQSDAKLMTLNETAASLVGGEISRQVIARFYPDWLDQLSPIDRAGLAVPPKPSEFALAMRRIRQEVDHLLAEGQVQEAEAFMEAERLKLVEKGYPLRKLNQAYFAFHGSYALSPGSIDPTGAQLRQLRAASPSLKSFLNRVGWLNSYDDYTAWLAEAGVN
ncbi:MAG: hypothetical protein HS126_27680 [Anaerolineales bacterium]|nr:hypothetical protein [Anaerolineales bacterium]